LCHILKLGPIYESWMHLTSNFSWKRFNVGTSPTPTADVWSGLLRRSPLPSGSAFTAPRSGPFPPNLEAVSLLKCGPPWEATPRSKDYPSHVAERYGAERGQIARLRLPLSGHLSSRSEFFFVAREVAMNFVPQGSDGFQSLPQLVQNQRVPFGSPLRPRPG